MTRLPHRRVALPAGEAVKYFLVARPLAPWIDQTTMAMDWYFLLRKGIEYRFTFRVPAQRLEELRPLFEKIVASVRLCDRASPLPRSLPDLPWPSR